MKACLETTGMFCSREKVIGLSNIQQNEKSTQILNISFEFRHNINRHVFAYATNEYNNK